MLPNQNNTINLEGLLEKLFEDSNESNLDQVKVVMRPKPAISRGECCSYSYTDYNG